MIVSPRPRRLSESSSPHIFFDTGPQLLGFSAPGFSTRPKSSSGVARTHATPLAYPRSYLQPTDGWKSLFNKGMSQDSSPSPSPPFPERFQPPAPPVTIAQEGDSSSIDSTLPPYQAAEKSVDTQVFSNRRLIVVLERASIEACRVDRGLQSATRTQTSKCTLLNCDEHQKLLMKMGREIGEARPDIVHQCLLTLLDSPLNKAGKLQIFIHTAHGIFIEVHPDVRIPRTFKRFSGLMVQLLQRGEITGAIDSKVLLRIINGPIAAHLPHNAIKFALTGDVAPRRLQPYLRSLCPSRPIAIFVGTMARGPDNFAENIVDDRLCISKHSLSASVVCGKFCCAVEDLWDIV